MKKVVIKGRENNGNILTTKCFADYLNAKGYTYYIYLKSKEENGYIRLANTSEIDDRIRENSYIFLKKDMGKLISMSDFMKYEDDIFLEEIDAICSEREDIDLVNIVESFNCMDYVKVVSIPDNVEYDVLENRIGYGESVVERHRVWS